VCRLLSLVTRLLHIAALGLHIQHTVVRGVPILTNPLTHSRAYVLLAAWPARARPLCLALAQLALSSPQLACTPPLQLGTRLLRVALDPQRLIHANFATGSECYFAEHVETKEQTNTATNTKTHYNTQTHAQEPHYNMYSAVGGEEATSEKLVIGRKRARAPRGNARAGSEARTRPRPVMRSQKSDVRKVYVESRLVTKHEIAKLTQGGKADAKSRTLREACLPGPCNGPCDRKNKFSDFCQKYRFGKIYRQAHSFTSQTHTR
jgi:hypothetical protein